MLGLDAYDFIGNLYGVRVACIQSCDEGVCVAGLYHHHTEIVAFEHLVVGFLICESIALTLLCQYPCISLAARRLVGVAEINYLYAVKAQLQLVGKLVYSFVVAQEYRMTDAFCLCLHDSLKHCRMYAFGEYYTLWMLPGCVVKFLCQFCLLTDKLAQLLSVAVPVCYRIACNATLYSRLCHCLADACDETRVDGLRNEICRTECQVVDMIYVIDNIRHRLLRQRCQSIDSGELHLFVDGFCMNVESATEDVREHHYIVYLVRIVRASGRHYDVRTGVNSVLV